MSKHACEVKHELPTLRMHDLSQQDLTTKHHYTIWNKASSSWGTTGTFFIKIACQNRNPLIHGGQNLTTVQLSWGSCFKYSKQWTLTRVQQWRKSKFWKVQYWPDSFTRNGNILVRCKTKLSFNTSQVLKTLIPHFTHKCDGAKVHLSTKLRFTPVCHRIHLLAAYLRIIWTSLIHQQTSCEGFSSLNQRNQLLPQMHDNQIHIKSLHHGGFWPYLRVKKGTKICNQWQT